MGLLTSLVKGVDDAARVTAKVADDLPLKPTVTTKNGVAQLRTQMAELSTGQRKTLTKRNQRLQEAQTRIDASSEGIEIIDELKGDPANLQRAVADNPDLAALSESKGGDVGKMRERLTDRLKKADEVESSELSNILEFTDTDEKMFRTAKGKKEKKLEEVARKLSGPLEQHHLLSKGITGAFMQRMDQLIAAGKGTVEDLVAMAKFAEETVGTSPGDRRANILNMQKEPHNRFHTAMEGQGIDESKKAMQKKLSKVKSKEELFDLWEDWLVEDGKYTKETAEIWESMESLIDEIQGKV